MQKDSETTTPEKPANFLLLAVLKTERGLLTRMAIVKNKVRLLGKTLPFLQQ